MRTFLQVTLSPNSAHTRKYNEIKPYTEEIPEFTEEEVERAIKRMKRHKAQGVDGITSDIIKLGGPNCSHLPNKYLQQQTEDKADSWQLAWSKNSHSVQKGRP